MIQSICNKVKASPVLKSRAEFCIAKTPNALDLTNNCLKDDYDESFLIGTGICEDTVYCSQLIECNVGGMQLNMAACKEILCSFWSEQKLSDDEKNANLEKFIQPGKCYASLSDKKNHWYTRLFDRNNDGIVAKDEIACQ